LVTDGEFCYQESYSFDVSGLSPQVALPGSVDGVANIEDAQPVPVTQVFIGTCTGGRLNDIKTAADILRGRQVAKGVRCLIVPASRTIFRDALAEGYVRDLVEAGAVFVTPGCGPCLGAHEGVLTAEDVCVSTSSRNFPGRMGSTEASIFVASPATAAASAVAGHLADPRDFVG
jgi:3-isopropylmalate/(R)-2-methylmalate dehydratase large subunit